MSVRQRVLHAAPLIVFALTIVFLGLSLAGYDPADPPGRAAEPVNQPPTNLCGPVGALFAHVLFTTLGWSSWLLILGLAVVNILAATRRPVPDKLGPALGFALVLIVAAGFFHKLAPTLMPSPAVGSGGYVGALAAIFLEVHFGLAGLILILTALGLFGLALCHDVIFLWPVQEVRAWIRPRPRLAHTAVHSHGAATMARAGAEEWERPSVLPAAAKAQSVSVHPPIPVTTANDAPPHRLQHPAITQDRVTSTARDLAPLPQVEPGSPFQLPPIEMLEPPTPAPIQEHEAKVHARAMLLERTLLDFGYQVRVVQIDTGPVITQFEIELEAGLRVSRIMSLADDLA
ncbi:MAG TPA: DNA translocase FtsK 4TM domain-containing protein, partial [Isosphaeraceae bacterium]|nr:DNA translocase FtsK 4TM domain-containing protein [Isosphaeraceae bacterium]